MSILKKLSAVELEQLQNQIKEEIKTKEGNDDCNWKDEANKSVNYTEHDKKDRTFKGYTQRNPGRVADQSEMKAVGVDKQ